MQTEFGLIHDSWASALEPVRGQLSELANFLDSEAAKGVEVFPSRANILRAFRIPFDAVRVVIVGQDPYPTPGHAVGLAFSVSPNTKPMPRSLMNIFRELQSDIEIPTPTTGDLSTWSDQGVMLLNRVLSVRTGEAGSHRRRGWEEVTECVLRALDEGAGKPLVAVLWGNDAQRAREFLPHSSIIESAHPSPLSASRGFFGSRPFSRVNELLSVSGGNTIDWSLE